MMTTSLRHGSWENPSSDSVTHGANANEEY